MSEVAIRDEADRAVKLYEQLIGQAATRTWPMFENYGYIGALSRLVVSADLQKGFKALRDGKRLDESFEAIVIRYKEFFSPDAIQAAQWRLDNAHALL